ncbi:MAG: DUF4153 domain-containing protein [Candidatus Krumholzibacteria bacterium]
MKRFTSLRLLVSGASATFLRFPLVLTTAAVAAASALALVEDSDNALPLRILLTSQLGIPLFFALSIFTESHRWSRPKHVLLLLGGLGALATYFVLLPDWVTPAAGIRYAQFNAGLHLLVAFLPFARTNQINGFWQYNKSLFLRFLIAVFYSGVLYVGLAVALAAIDKLLGVDVEGESYLRLWIVIAAVFNTWFFLGGVPEDLPALEDVKDYPKGLKVFTQYILIPLIVVYLAILTLHLGKIVVTREWPSGWLGYLVSSVATAGILAMLLVHPVKGETGNKWVGSFSRWFYILLSPSIIMLLLAIWKRIDQYGFTEKRYFLLLLAVWLAAISIYFVFSRSRNIKVIPASLCIIAFATAYGPWGASSVSRRSQTGRLENVLVEAGLLAGGRIGRATEEVPFDDRKEITAILTFLIENQGTRGIEPWFGEAFAELDTLQQSTAPWGRSTAPRVRALMTHMGLEYVPKWQSIERGNFYFNIDHGDRTYAIDAADYYVKLTRPAESHYIIPAPGDTLSLVFDTDRSSFEIRRDGETVIALALALLFEQVAGHKQASPNTTRFPPEVMRIEGENDRARMIIYFNSISGDIEGERRSARHFDADCFIKLK